MEREIRYLSYLNPQLSQNLIVRLFSDLFDVLFWIGITLLAVSILTLPIREWLLPRTAYVGGVFADSVNILSDTALGTTYITGEPLISPTRINTLYAWSANRGYAPSQFLLGNRIEYGIGSKADPVKAVGWYKLAAEQGYAPGQLALALHYWQPSGSEASNIPLAADWLKKASAQGEAKAQCALANLYTSGEGLPQDYAQAFTLLTQSADEAGPWCQTSLGNAYRYGLGVKRNEGIAMQWYRKAADDGSKDAMLEIGKLYEAGLGVPQDKQQAIAWYRKAADAGSPAAKLWMAETMASGERRAIQPPPADK